MKSCENLNNVYVYPDNTSNNNQYIPGNNNVHEKQNSNTNIIQEQNTVTNNEQKYNFCKKNKMILILAIGISVVVIIVAVVLIIVLTKKDDDSSEIDNSSQKEEDDFITLGNNEKVIVKLSYNINELSIYNEQSNTTMSYSYDPDSSTRRLTESITNFYLLFMILKILLMELNNTVLILLF